MTSRPRDRGRPQVRPDEDTLRIIYEAARHEFADSGFAATSMETVARQAGVSTKTLYRLVESKSALFERMVTDRIERFLAEVKLDTIANEDVELALQTALMASAALALDKDVVALQRTILRDSGQFSDVSKTFYTNGILRSTEALAGWLDAQKKRGVLAIDDAKESAGILLGMVVSAPQRAAIFGGVPLPSKREIEKRVRTCAALFLRGCQVRSGGM